MPTRDFIPLWLKKICLAIFFPLALLGALEGGLRVTGFGHATTFFVRDENAGMLRTNPRFTELFFPAQFGLKPLNFRLPGKKPEGAFRVFLLGESAAMGVPEPGFALVPQIRAQLQHAHPDRRIEVYNLGVTAINSHAVRLIAREALSLQPDLLVIYMGNNEVVGPYGPGSSVTDSVLPVSAIRASLWIKRTRVGQLLQRLVGLVGSGDGRSTEWRGMEMFAGKTVGADDPRLATVYRNFSANLSDMLDAARRAKVKVVLSTVAVNLRECAPFASIHRATLSGDERAKFDETYAAGIFSAETENWVAARENFERALAIDSNFADAHFSLARVFEKLGDDKNARIQFLESRDKDALRFRADARLNEIIRRAAAAREGEVALIDAAKELGAESDSASPLTDHRFFFEHVHLTWDGNYALAALLARGADALGFQHTLAPLDQNQMAARLGYTTFGASTLLLHMEELTGRPPFTAQQTFAEDRAALLQAIARANAELASRQVLGDCATRVDRALAADRENAFLAFHAAALAMRTNAFDRALTLNEDVRRLEPRSPENLAQRAFASMELRRGAEAEALLLESAKESPYYFQTYGLLAQLWLREGKAANGAAWFKDLAARLPSSRGAHEMYAELLAASGDTKAAEAEWENVLRLSPDSETALLPLLKNAFAANDVAKAKRLMLEAYRYNPRSFANDARLQQIAEADGDLAKNIEYLQAMAASGPVRTELHFDLADLLAKAGRSKEALVELYRARREAHLENDAPAASRADEAILAHESHEKHE